MSVYRICVKASVAALALGACLTLLVACDGGAKSPAETPSAGETPTVEAPASETPESETLAGGDATAFSLVSEAFGNDETIPALYTCDGDNVSPALSWSGVPEGTNAFALIMDDPDAPGGTFTHWVLFNLPGSATDLPEGVETVPMPAYGPAGTQGSNDGGGIGYTGPCPPPGDPHRYNLTVYALAETVALEPGATKDELLAAMAGHVLAEARLVGVYGR